MNSSRTVSKIMVIGGNGVLAPLLIEYLAALDERYEVSVLCRHKSDVGVPQGVNIVRSDFSYRSLVKCFEQQRFAVDMVASMDVDERKILIDAIVDAGVERLIPGEFSSNMENPTMIALWDMHGDRVKIRDYLRQKSKQNQSFSWTAVTVGPFYDWALKVGFMRYNLQEETAEIFDDGLKPFCATTLQKTCAVVDSIYRHLPDTENKVMYVSSFTTNQLEVLSVLENNTGTKWKVSHKSTDRIIEDARRKLAEGKAIGQMELLLAAIYAPQFGSDWTLRAHQSDVVLGLMPEDIQDVTQNIVNNKDEGASLGLLARY